MSKKFWPVLLLVLAACGKEASAPPSPRVAEGDLHCPEAMWASGEMRPASIEVINLSNDSVLVFLDRCRGHTRVGEVGVLETKLLEMPDGALSFRGMLRFYTYRGPRRQVGVELASTDADPHLKLVVPEAIAMDCPQVVVDGEVVSSNIRIPQDSIASITYDAAPEDDLRSCGRIIVTTKP